MRILLIGYDPHDIGGTQNYTRPLAQCFTKLGHKTFYLYSGAWNRKYNWLFKPYLKYYKNDFTFDCAEIINSPNWTYNFESPILDIHCLEAEALFKKYIKKINPDIMHVHSRTGIPVSIIKIASQAGIKVFNTIHIYGLLCPKRVMIDKSGNVCEGPTDFKKCVDCFEHIDVKKAKFFARMENTNKNLLKILVNCKRILTKGSKDPMRFSERIKEPNNDKDLLALQLKQRLDYIVEVMNRDVVTNICVSSDVKKNFVRFGVKEENLCVQHIGTTVAEIQKRSIQKLHNPIVIGCIGGIAYYKGTHILIQAIRKIKKNNFTVKIFGKYEAAYLKKILRGYEDLPIKFFGEYRPKDLPDILGQIDVMVLPSICNDTAPQTIFETYSAGIPIIASDIGGFPDFVKNGKNGYLFKVGDSQDLAEKIDLILGDSGKIRIFSNNIPLLKSIKENANELIELYKKSLSRRNL